MSKRLRAHFGKRGYNKVIVFQREVDGPFWVEWWDGRGDYQRKSLGKHVGTQNIYDFELACTLGKKLADSLETKSFNATVSQLVKSREIHTIHELIDRYEAHHQSEWSESHARDQARMGEFWKEELGHTRTLLFPEREVVIESIAKEAASKRGWSARSTQAYLVYIQAVYRFAARMLHWISVDEELTAIRKPTVKASRSQHFTKAQIKALLASSWDVDPRIGVAVRVAVLTGRRSGAIANLKITDLTEINGRPALRFDAGADKAGKEGFAIIDAECERMVRELSAMARPKSCGWLMPYGDLRKPSKNAQPVDSNWLARTLKTAEDAAEVEHVKGRGMHGFKRSLATLASDRKAASKQSGTRQDTLETYYEKEDYAAAAEMVDEMSARLSE